MEKPKAEEIPKASEKNSKVEKVDNAEKATKTKKVDKSDKARGLWDLCTFSTMVWIQE